jgi:tetratricopeptide (TPR) repeat protein
MCSGFGRPALGVIVLPLLIVIPVLCRGAQAPAVTYRDCMSLASGYEQQKQIQDAVEQYRTCTRLFPRDPAAAGHLGLALAAQKDYFHALDAFRKAAELAPRDLSIQFELFKTQLALKRFNDATATAKRIIDQSPATPELFNRLAAAEAEAGDYRDAIASLEEAASLNPEDYPTQYNLGLAWFKAGDAARALAVLEPLRRDPARAEIENLLGDVFERLGRHLDAARAFQRAAEGAPHNEDYRFDFILELMRHDTFSAAVAVAEPAATDFPRSLRMRLALGIALFGNEQFEKASNVLFETARAFPQSELALHVLVFAAEASREKLDQVQALLESYQKTHSNEFLPYYLLGRIEMMKGVAARAAPLLIKSAELNPDFADTQFELGKALDDLGQKRQAADRYRRAVQLQPDLAQAWYRLSRVLQDLEQPAEARASLRKFRELREHEGERNAVVRFLIGLR